jgi:hypothetical protein
MRHHKTSAIEDEENIESRKLFWQLATSILLILFVAEPLVFPGWYI